MIPLRLELRDFLSYEQPEPIDFTHFDVACLTGDNGAGKSALLDAITFALFGAARGCEGGRNQERLIRDGADEAVVDFSFALGGSTYRIVRRRNRKTGQLQLHEERDASWTDIGGDSLRETEQKIASILRMDYRTFTASAFFVQGRADDFLRMTAEHRKEVFSKLLDLDVYERLDELARERARDAERCRGAHERRVHELAEAPELVKTLEAQLDEVQARAQHAQDEAATAAAAAEALRRQVAELAADEVGLERDRKALASLEQRIAAIGSGVETKSAALDELDGLVARADELRAATAEAQRLRDEERDLRARQEQDAEMHRLEAEALSAIETERAGLERSIAEATTAADAADAQIATLTKAERDLAQVEADLEGVEGVHIELEAGQQRLAAAQSNAARLEERIAAAASRADEIHENMRILERGTGECPVCGSALDDAHRRNVARRFNEELRRLDTERESATATLEVARKEAGVAGEQIRRLGAHLTERDDLRGRREALRSRLERLPALRDDATRWRTEAAANTELGAGDEFGVELQAKLDSIRTERAAIYDAAVHDDLRRRLDELAQAERELGRMEQALVQRGVLAAELEQAREAQAAACAESENLRAAIGKLAERVAGLGPARERLSSTDSTVARLQELASRTAAEAAALAERLAAARRNAVALVQARAAERDAADAKRRYARLAEAFGRRGIPDRIIDNARPALQQEADEILGRLSGHTMSVRFEMQRETKSGKPRDTFDVMVRHDGGDRDFAMFSGGEAFRIAFAVRLALSKLLVDRAGASLQTLVVDEGFGTQDPVGRERLVEALRMARTDLGFAKLLVITHLEDLKDLFGAQIHVTKDPARGSVVHVVRT